MIKKLKEIIFKIRHYDGLAHDYNCVLEFATMQNRKNYKLNEAYNQIDKYNEELIDLACLWLQKHQSEYIQKRTNGELYVSGACLTELRYYLNKKINSD